MKDLKLTIQIDKPAKDIFEFTLNPKNTPKWIDFITVEETNEWPPKLGTMYRNRGEDGDEWSELELTEYDPYKRFTLSEKDGSYNVRYTFTPLKATKTELEYYEWTDRDELSVPFTMEPLEKLKRILEAMENSPNLRGDIIEESLANNSTLKAVSIISTRVEPVTPEHKTPWLKQWTLHTIEVPEDEASAIAEQLSHAIETERQNWYIDFKNDTTHYVIFPNKVFKIDRSQPEQYKPVVSYGIKLGVPRHQLDFSPEIKYWERPEGQE
jgi:uncharacterized protein YndB with AHSA1/START domain